jgi:hypothetical protein
MYKQVYDTVNTVYTSIYLYMEENIAFWTYRWNPTHVPPIEHGNQGGIAYPRLARHVEITVSQCNCLHFILVRWNLLRAWMRVDFLEQCFIVLEVASSCMETDDAHEDILVVSQVCHSLEILYVGMLV